MTHQRSPAQDSGPPYDVGPYSGDHFLSGVQLGYDRQIGSAVFGVEASYDVSLSSGEKVAASQSETDTIYIKSLGMLTGRVGYLVLPQLRAYAKGGFAWSRFRYISSDPQWSLLAKGQCKS
jgi:opacity protein-like surface antigen